MSNYFPNIIGQEPAVGQLTFFLNNYQKHHIFPNLLITGSRGYGKTAMVRTISQNLWNQEDTAHKKYVEITGADFQKGKALESFIENVIEPYTVGNQECTLFFDEIHLADPTVLNWLLHVCEINSDNTTRNTYKDREFNFDFRYFTFLSATTNPEKLSKPLISRLERIDLQPYSLQNLADILVKHTKDKLVYKENVATDIVKSMRGNPRYVVSFLSRKLLPYVADKKEFTPNDWTDLKKQLSIHPLGLHSNEIQLLKFLHKRQSATLTEIACFLGLDSGTVRRDCESFLLSNYLIRIDGKRYITGKGTELIEALDKTEKAPTI